MWRGAIGLWTLGCALLLSAVSTGAMAWAMLALAGLCGSVVWLCTGAVVALRRQWTRKFLLRWLVWPVAAGVVSLLYVTDLPLKARVFVSAGSLEDFAEDARKGTADAGPVGLFWVSGYCVRDGCVFLEAGESLDGLAGLLHVPDGIGPPSHPEWSLTVSRHLTGPWWYFETRS